MRAEPRLALTSRQRIIGLLVLIAIALLWARYAYSVRWTHLAGVDNFAYWDAWRGGGLYAEGAELSRATYIYSPAFAQLIYPLTLLPWDVFRAAWILMAGAAFTWLLWPLPGLLRLGALMLAWYFALGGNADWIIALAIGVSLSHPGAWAAPLLTKVTPGVGVAWFAFRGEWRAFRVAIGVTAGIALVSFLAAPGLWFDWANVLIDSTEHTAHGYFFGLPVPSLLVRLPIAVALLLWGARRGAVWTLPASALLAQADVWGVTVVFFTALPRLWMAPVAPLAPWRAGSAWGRRKVKGSANVEAATSGR